VHERGRALRPGPGADRHRRRRRVRREEVEAVFADGWRVDEIAPATLEVTVDPAGVRAGRAALTRV
jgi:hypothetical protein